MEIFHEFTPLVSTLVSWERFLDVAGSVRLFGSPVEIAHQLREQVRRHRPGKPRLGSPRRNVTGLRRSARNPNGLLEISPERTLAFLHPLPIEAILGRRRRDSEAVARSRDPVGDLAREPLEGLRRIVGAASAQKLHDLADGRDAR